MNPAALVVRAALIGVMSLPVSCTRGPEVGSSDPGASAGAAPDDLSDGWRVATPESVGLDGGLLAAMTDTIRANPDLNLHAVLVERRGSLVYEEYFRGDDQRWGESIGRVAFEESTLHDLRSVTKSVTSALVGIALSQGLVRSVEQPVFELFPEHADLGSPAKRAITLRHVLTMTAGLRWEEWNVPYSDPSNDERRMHEHPDPVEMVLARPLDTAPGTVWNYSGGLTHLLGEVVHRGADRPLPDYARDVLFGPLDIVDFEWSGDGAGHTNAASGLRLRPRDLAKFGSLYLHEGRWNDRPVVPSEWVRESTRRRIGVRDSIWSGGETGYGYHWWHDRLMGQSGPVESHTAVGNGGQRLFVLPSLGMVVTMVGGRYNDPSAGTLAEDLLLAYVIPAAEGG